MIYQPLDWVSLRKIEKQLPFVFLLVEDVSFDEFSRETIIDYLPRQYISQFMLIRANYWHPSS